MAKAILRNLLEKVEVTTKMGYGGKEACVALEISTISCFSGDRKKLL